MSSILSEDENDDQIRNGQTIIQLEDHANEILDSTNKQPD